MRSDKIAILSKVNEGKISPEEGYHLYEALKSQLDSEEEQASESDANCAESDFESELRQKMNSIYKDAEPYLRKMILSALETVAFVSETVKEKIHAELSAAKDK